MTKEQKIESINQLIQDDTKLLILIRMEIVNNLVNVEESKLDLFLAALQN